MDCRGEDTITCRMGFMHRDWITLLCMHNLLDQPPSMKNMSTPHTTAVDVRHLCESVVMGRGKLFRLLHRRLQICEDVDNHLNAFFPQCSNVHRPSLLVQSTSSHPFDCTMTGELHSLVVFFSAVFFTRSRSPKVPFQNFISVLAIVAVICATRGAFLNAREPLTPA